jgi:hypothetical protein
VVWELTDMGYATIEYLLAAVDKAGASRERQVDVAALREEVSPYLNNSPPTTRAMLNALEFRNLITTKEADSAQKAGFFWITDRGLEVAIEARMRGFTWPPKPDTLPALAPARPRSVTLEVALSAAR